MHGRTNPDERVMVFVDGQNLYHLVTANFGKRTRVHPVLLARALAGDRTLVGVRYYSGVHARGMNDPLREMTDRRHQFMRSTGATVVERELMYSSKLVVAHSDRNARRSRPFGQVFKADVMWHRQGHEKGIDLRLALDAVEFALEGSYDVGIVVSSDTDLCEIPRTIHSLSERYVRRGLLDGHVTMEAGVVASSTSSVQPHFAYTHEIDHSMVMRCAERIDFAAASKLELATAASAIRTAANIAGPTRRVGR